MIFGHLLWEVLNNVRFAALSTRAGVKHELNSLKGKGHRISTFEFMNLVLSEPIENTRVNVLSFYEYCIGSFSLM